MAGAVAGGARGPAAADGAAGEVGLRVAWIDVTVALGGARCGQPGAEEVDDGVDTAGDTSVRDPPATGASFATQDVEPGRQGWSVLPVPVTSASIPPAPPVSQIRAAPCPPSGRSVSGRRAVRRSLPAALRSARATSDDVPSGDQSAAAGTTLVLHVRTTAFATLDLGAPGPSAGDSSFRKDDVTSPAGASVGVMNSTCVAKVPSEPFQELDQLCAGVIDLGVRGQIHWQSSTVDVPPPPPPPLGPAASGGTAQPAPVRRSGPWAVLGGTGRYQRVGGQIIDLGPGAADRVLRVRLLER